MSMRDAVRQSYGKPMGSGLPCRAPDGCELGWRFRPSDSKSRAALLIAIDMRNTHELDVHAYVHIAAETESPKFGSPAGSASGFSRKARLLTEVY